MSRERRCFICSEQILTSGKNIFDTQTDYSKKIISEMLEKLVGYKLDNFLEFSQVCTKCVQKINDYDFALITAGRLEKELLDLLRQTDEKIINVEYKEENEIDEIDDPIEIDDSNTILYTVVNVEPDFSQEGNEYEMPFLTSDHDNNTKEEYAEEENLETEYEYNKIFTEEDNKDFELDINNERPFSQCADSSLDKEKCNRKDVKIIRSQEILYACLKCEKVYKTVEKLQEHTKRHCKGKRYICDICGIGYKNITALNIHVGIHNGISPFECNVCGKKFTQKGALTRHRPMHTGEKPYQCDKCGKQFTHYSSFHMHKLAHDDVRNKKCEICGLKLRSTSHLNRHMLVHTGQKPHACPLCGLCFAQRYNMTSHFRSHHGIHRKTKYNCLICNESFPKKTKLLEHLSNSSCNTNELTQRHIELLQEEQKNPSPPAPEDSENN